MKAIILAAGRGSRMEDMTDDKPKCMVRLNGRPLIEWQIDALKKGGVEEIGIVTGYKNEIIQPYAGTEFHNADWATTNMVSSLACAEEWLSAGPCVISYSDIFYAPQAVEILKKSEASIAITYDPNWLSIWEKRFEDPLDDAETFKIAEDQTLLEIGNKPDNLDQVEGQYMGLIRMTPEGWQEVQTIRSALPDEERRNVHMTGLLQKVIDRGAMSVKALPYTDEWGEIDSVSDLKAYEA